MDTQSFNIRYLVLHIIPACDWLTLTYQQKKDFHHIVTVSGKKIAMKALDAGTGCIEIAYVGGKQYAEESEALFTLLLDLWIEHAAAKIVYATDLYRSEYSGPFADASHWLRQHLPLPVLKVFSRYHNLFQIRSLFPLV